MSESDITSGVAVAGADEKPAGFARHWYFSLTIFFSSFLLFQIQPILGKYILPWFGGTSTVWTTCMMVYQVLLLGGYVYAHLVSGMSVKKHVRVHLSILAVSLVLFVYFWFRWVTPIMPGPAWRPVDSSAPVLQIVEILMVCIGLPFLILSSTSSLVQKWFSILNPGKSPYGFYMISNIGSMLALVTYPFLFEPFFRLRTQATIWSSVYLVFLVICGACALMVLIKSRSKAGLETAVRQDGAPAAGPGNFQVPPLKMHLAWLILSFLPCVLLLATSSEMTQEVAPIPLLWVLPLALYLLSFIISFSPRTILPQGIYVIMVPVSAFMTWMVLQHIDKFGIIASLSAFSLMLFSCCMLCNTTLYQLRPSPAHLTRYYVVIAFGGALGGLFVGLAAPMMFNSYFEFFIGLILCCAIATVMLIWKRKQKWMRFLWIPLTAFSIVVIILLSQRSVLWFNNTLLRSRNFYGVLSVRTFKWPFKWVKHSLVHGRTNHGMQLLNSPMEFMPVSYYGKGSGLWHAMQRYSLKPQRIGVVGLGAGMMCVYGREGDYMRFYEINPEIVRIAKDRKYFTYLSECPAEMDIVMGDARLSLERELKQGNAQQFDVLVLDAFNSDAVPVHLLTREAFELYLKHLKPGGIIAVDVSNSYLDLFPAIWAQKKYFNLDGALIFRRAEEKRLIDNSIWILLSADSSWFLMPAIKEVSYDSRRIRDIEGWTDDYSSLFPLLINLKIDSDAVSKSFQDLLHQLRIKKN